MERKFKITVNGREYDVTVEDLSSAPSTILPGPGDMKVPSAPAQPPAQPASPASSPSESPPLDPGELPSPLAGVVAAIEVKAGDRVESGQKVAEIEAMKMKTTVAAHRSGRVVAVHVSAGSTVDAGQSLMSLE